MSCRKVMNNTKLFLEMRQGELRRNISSVTESFILAWKLTQKEDKTIGSGISKLI